MKNLFSILFLFIVFISMNSSLKAQEAQGNVFIVQTMRELSLKTVLQENSIHLLRF